MSEELYVIYLNKLMHVSKERGAGAIALIDPDSKNDDILYKLISLINKCDFDFIFVGGSMISDHEFDTRIKFIKDNSNLPLIIFPGSFNQLSKYADAILYLSLKYLSYITCQTS